MLNYIEDVRKSAEAKWGRDLSNLFPPKIGIPTKLPKKENPSWKSSRDPPHTQKERKTERKREKESSSFCRFIATKPRHIHISWPPKRQRRRRIDFWQIWQRRWARTRLCSRDLLRWRGCGWLEGKRNSVPLILTKNIFQIF